MLYQTQINDDIWTCDAAADLRTRFQRTDSQRARAWSAWMAHQVCRLPGGWGHVSMRSENGNSLTELNTLGRVQTFEGLRDGHNPPPL
ncbi:hypothetical protein A0H81_05183 [Grifola frondosa]|uniref:Uncharacterized protein n=1 Tax=Grifola frondosa TaxID=5627 RepID=A0A1C7MIU0_GRIFR|nr:hypothetical protein A0H81_05183 [Grifola frondosa]